MDNVEIILLTILVTKVKKKGKSFYDYYTLTFQR